ncbi:MAG: periplasmic heavy metal sensor [Epsilonproteobacteria bacterium]|nr:hypothetical protein [Campylobacterota bacterium]NPA56852.1 periplasmic heavy metal sensor [Campylobacterota bacterium]
MRGVFLTLLLILSLFGSEGEYGEEYSDDHDHIPYDLSFLHLSPNQKERIRELLLQRRKQLTHLYRRERELEERLRQLFQKREFDREEYERLYCSLQQLKMALERDFFASLHSILTPEQRRKFARYYKEWEVE